VYCDLLLSPLLPGVLDLKHKRKKKSTDVETNETAVVKLLVNLGRCSDLSTKGSDT